MLPPICEVGYINMTLGVLYAIFLDYTFTDLGLGRTDYLAVQYRRRIPLISELMATY